MGGYSTGPGSVTFVDAASTFVDDVDTTKKLAFQLSGITTGTTRTSTWQDVSGTVYVSGGSDVTLADGGLNASLTASNGGIFYSTATAAAILAGTATANSVLVSGATAAPTWALGWTSFTPTVTLVGGAGNTVPVYTDNYGRYLRLANMVFIYVRLSLDGGAEGAGTGQINIAVPVSFTDAVKIVGGIMINGTSERIVIVENNGATMKLSYQSTVGAGDIVALTGDDQNNVTRDINLNFFYSINF